MKSVFAYIYVMVSCCVALFLTGCDRVPTMMTDEPSAPVRLPMANLDINVFTHMEDARLKDTRNKKLREGYGEELGDELIHTLRIVIVRPDGTVEHNRFIKLGTAVAVCGDQTFRVVADEWKQIYLLANEGLTRTKNGTAGNDELVTPKFDYIEEGKPFPRKALENAVIRLEGESAELDGPLPMNECHRVWMPKENYACSLFVTRAAVKFSFVVTNNGGHDLAVGRLTIDKLLDAEYLLPRNAVYGLPDAEGVRDILEFDVPPSAGAAYGTFSKAFPESIPLPEGGEVLIGPIYLLEGKYTDENGAMGSNGERLNYSVSMSFEGLGIPDGEWDGVRYLANLPRLPRNTHVAVKAIVGKSNISWTAEVLPYTEVPLDPVFGL